MALGRRTATAVTCSFFLLLAFSLATPAVAALSREVRDADTDAVLRAEGQPPTGNAAVDAAYTHMGDVYDFYSSQFGLTSWPLNGGVMIVTVGSNDGFYAFTADAHFEPAAAQADDIVARELTRALLRHLVRPEGNTIPEWQVDGVSWNVQAGLLVDALSDVMGELVDLGNSRGNDAAGQKWVIGEDWSGMGPLRNLLHPELFDDPGRVSDTTFYCGSVSLQQNGGSVPAHALALIADGGDYNGQTIAGIGTAKTAQVAYRMMNAYLGRGTTFANARRYLRQSCDELVGTSGITAADCAEVQKAVDAVELAGAVCGLAQADLCPAGQTATAAFLDDFETANATWEEVQDTPDPLTTWVWGGGALRHASLPAGKRFHVQAIDQPFNETPLVSSLTLRNAVTIPSGARLAFDSYLKVATGYDGGVVEYSVDGGTTWADVLPLYLAGLNYSTTPIRTDVGNPLAGRRAFAGSSTEYESSVYNLSSLADQDALLRFRWGLDATGDASGSFSTRGWHVDNVRIYTCGGGSTGGVVTMAAATASVAEGAGSVVLTVNRAGGDADGVVVAYRTNDGAGTASAGSDYTSTTGTITFAEGETSKTISIPILNDTAVDPGETLVVELTSVSGADATLGVPASTTVTITDDDVSADTQIQFLAAGFTVGEAGVTAKLVVTRTGVLTGVSTVRYATSDGTARAGTDYAARQGVLTFIAGQAKQAFLVPIVNDCLAQGAHTLTATLSNATGGALGSQVDTVLTINDNDTAGRVRFLVADSAVNEAGRTAPIVVVREGGSACGVLVDYATQNLTAEAGADYTTAAGTLSFGPGQMRRAFTVGILQDEAQEPRESLSLSLTNPQGGAVLGTPAAATLNIVDDESVVEFSQTGFAVSEAGLSAQIVVKRTGGLTRRTTVAYETLTTGTATDGVDFRSVAGVLAFPVGLAARKIAIPILNDRIIEGPETVQLRLSAPTGGFLGTQTTTTLRINDDDFGGQIEFASALRRISENAGTANLAVVWRGGNVRGVTVAYSSAPGNATEGSDYQAVSGTLTFPVGVTQRPIPLRILQDKLSEGTETLTLTLSSPTGGADIGTAGTMTVEIADDEPAVEFALTRYQAYEGEPAQITVTRSGALTKAASVELATEGGSAVPGTDYQPFSGAITFAAGQSQRTLNIATVENNLAGGEKTIGLTLRNASGAVLGARSTADVFLADDDYGGAVSLSASAYFVDEGTPSVTITVLRGNGSASGATVDLLVSPGTATAGADYEAPAVNPVTITFGASETSRTLTIPILNDSLVENPETISLTLSNPAGGASLGAFPAATITIEDDESQTMIHLDTAAVTVPDATCQVPFTVSRHGPAGNTDSVDFVVGGGTATPGEDYMAQNGTLTFAPGVRERRIVVTVCGDDDPEPPETVLVTLSNPSAGVLLGTPAQGVLTIVDPDPVPGVVSFTGDTFSVMENAGSVTVCVIRNGDAAGVTVHYATAGATATPGVDYTAISGDLAFVAGQACQWVTVPIIDDADVEGAESVVIQLSNPTGGATLGAVSSTTIWIVDND